MEPLQDYTVRKLLEKFGLGGHKPGSGSAAAFQGMLSAQLIRTVISLTNEEKRRSRFLEWLPKLLEINTEIESNVYPALEYWFQEDSVQFDVTVKLRIERDVTTDPVLKSKLREKALEALKLSTEIPIDIAKLCVQLGDFASITFDHGFQTVRGDSAVALNAAISAIAGCLSIIELNLLSFPWNEWASDVRYEANILRVAHQKLLVAAANCQAKLEAENDLKVNKSFESAFTNLRSERWEEVRLSDSSIEKLVGEIQDTLWIYRNLIWKDNVPGTYLDVLQPDVVIEKLMGYQFGLASLGKHVIENEEFDIAGEIDKERKIVRVSRAFPEEVRNFTAAHELGHALLHKGMILHRDRRMDGSSPQNRDFRERQADRFATFFLMPENLIRLAFKDRFGNDRFVINDNNAFMLGKDMATELRAKVRNVHGLALHLAAIDQIRIRNFPSMAKLFKVSVGAMAVRLRELDMIEF